MNTQPACVRQVRTFRMVDEPDEFDVETELEYRRDQPYTVTATFRIGDDDGVQWQFARDLLMEGMIMGAGDGDVHISPHWIDGDVIMIELCSPDGCALFAAPAAALAEFLSATYAVVEAGAEHRTIDIDAELTTLLGNGAF